MHVEGCKMGRLNPYPSDHGGQGDAPTTPPATRCETGVLQGVPLRASYS